MRWRSLCSGFSRSNKDRLQKKLPSQLRYLHLRAPETAVFVDLSAVVSEPAGAEAIYLTIRMSTHMSIRIPLAPCSHPAHPETTAVVVSRMEPAFVPAEPTETIDSAAMMPDRHMRQQKLSTQLVMMPDRLMRQQKLSTQLAMMPHRLVSRQKLSTQHMMKRHGPVRR